MQASDNMYGSMYGSMHGGAMGPMGPLAPMMGQVGYRENYSLVPFVDHNGGQRLDWFLHAQGR